MYEVLDVSLFLPQMNSFAKLKHPYIVEYKDFWIDEVSCRILISFSTLRLFEALMRLSWSWFFRKLFIFIICQAGRLYMHSDRLLWRRRPVSNRAWFLTFLCETIFWRVKCFFFSTSRCEMVRKSGGKYFQEEVIWLV